MPKQEDIILNFMTQVIEKWNSLALSRLVWRCHGIRYFHFYFFCLEPMVKKNIWMRTISVTIMVIISKVLFWVLLDISKNISDTSYVQSTFLTFIWHIDIGISKTPCSWRFYGYGSICVLILPWVNIMKRKWANASRKLSAVQKPEPVLWRTFHFSQANLDFKFNLVLIE